MNGVPFLLFFLGLVAVVWNLIHEQGRQVFPTGQPERDECERPGCTRSWQWDYHGQLICTPHLNERNGAKQ